ncbi:MAG: hypothetical protein RI949_1548 [Pseudomonadota bacterium]|jgi:flagellar protein FliO/FliZ
MTTGNATFDWLQYLLSFALVIGLMLALLWGLKKLQVGNGLGRRHQGRLQVLESVAIGPRQKIALVRVDNREVLIGVTPQQVSGIDSFPAVSRELQS